MNKEIEIPEGYQARIEGNKVVLIPKESEDERIRKAIWLVLVATENDQDVFYRTHNLTRKKCTDWLEKLKEQPTNEEMLRTLRVEYEKGVADTIAKYEQKEQKPVTNSGQQECEQWNELQADFKRINEAFENGKNEVINRPEAFGLQKPAEWSVEDERNYEYLHQIICNYINNPQIEYKKRERASKELIPFWERLKSLRPQPHWKPSEEQPEVDLEKEVDATMKRYLYHITCREEQISFARHFYELGLKARKEE